MVKQAKLARFSGPELDTACMELERANERIHAQLELQLAHAGKNGPALITATRAAELAGVPCDEIATITGTGPERRPAKCFPSLLESVRQNALAQDYKTVTNTLTESVDTLSPIGSPPSGAPLN